MFFNQSEQVGYVRNCQRDSHAIKFYESWTGDGPGGAYFGAIQSVDGTLLTLAAAADLTHNIVGDVVVFTNGKGAGQLGRVAFANSTTQITLEQPLTIDVDPTDARVSIVAYRGDIILGGNLFEEGSVVEDYGMQMKSVWAHNTLKDMTIIPQQTNDGPGGLNLHGRVYQGGVEPAYFNEILYNRLINCTGGITTITTTSTTFSGPYIRALVVKHNIIQQQGGIFLTTNVSDSVIEHNQFDTPNQPFSKTLVISAGADHYIATNNLANVTGLATPSNYSRPCAYVPAPPPPSSSSSSATRTLSALLSSFWWIRPLFVEYEN